MHVACVDRNIGKAWVCEKLASAKREGTCTVYRFNRWMGGSEREHFYLYPEFRKGSRPS